jgi:[CysO sulfur-carrier protein]-S-L-cysteine hydrolase
MKLLLPGRIRSQWANVLRSAGRREIGGVLLGEFIKPATFKIAEITVQRTGGTFSHFVRDPKLHEKAIEAFFERTGRNFERFNYLGEWHSHPSFSTRPSPSDARSMYRIVSASVVGANFAALVIVRLGPRKELEMSACVFRSGQPIEEVRIYREHLGSAMRGWNAKGWIKSLGRGRPVALPQPPRREQWK